MSMQLFPLNLKLQYLLYIHNKSQATKSSSWLPLINLIYKAIDKPFLHLKTSWVSPWVFPCKVCSRALLNLMLISSFLFSLVLPVFFQAYWEIGAMVVRLIALLGISELNEIGPVVWAITFGSSRALVCWAPACSADQVCLVLCSCFYMFVGIELFLCSMFLSQTILDQSHLFGLSMKNMWPSGIYC